eukprot:Tbor_TRINITY_DN6230_c2_g2::TRINITY_DN6230_c2_g2_i12::g.1724::m.1724
MSLQEFSQQLDHMDAEFNRKMEVENEKLLGVKRPTYTSGLHTISHVNANINKGDISLKEPSLLLTSSSGKGTKFQKVWDKFLSKLEEEEVTFEEIIGCEDRKQFIADCGFVHTDAAIIATQWGKLLSVSDNTSKGPDCNAMLQNDMIETAEMKHFPYLATIIPKEKAWWKFEESLQNSAVETKENLLSIFHAKITSKTISPYDACVLNYLLSDDMDKWRLIFLILKRNREEDRIKFHNIRVFEAVGIERQSEQARVLENIDTPFFPLKKHRDLNSRMIDKALLESKGEPTDMLERIFLPKSETVKGGELRLDIMPDGRVNADIVESAVNQGLTNAFNAHQLLSNEVEVLRQQLLELQQVNTHFSPCPSFP